RGALGVVAPLAVGGLDAYGVALRLQLADALAVLLHLVLARALVLDGVGGLALLLGADGDLRLLELHLPQQRSRFVAQLEAVGFRLHLGDEARIALVAALVSLRNAGERLAAAADRDARALDLHRH